MDLDWVAGIVSAPFTYMMLLALVISVLTYGVRDFLSLNAGLAVALFFGLFVMSNAWRFTSAMPEPSGVYETDLAALDLWVSRAKAGNELAKLLGLAGIAGVYWWSTLGRRDRAPTLTRLWAYTIFAAQATEVPEFYLCSLTSEWLGREHIAIMEGLDRGACSREFGWWGSFVAPGIATLPLIVVLWKTLEKRFWWFGARVWWSVLLRVWRAWRRV